MEQLAPPPLAQRLVGGDDVAAEDAGDELARLPIEPGGSDLQRGDGHAHSLARRDPEHALGRGVPSLHALVETDGDDGVVGVLDDAREPALVLLRLSARRDVAEHVDVGGLAVERERSRAHLDRQLMAVAAGTCELVKTYGGGRGRWLGEHADDRIVAAGAEEAAGLRVLEDDASVGTRRHHSVGHRLEEPLEPLGGLPRRHLGQPALELRGVQAARDEEQEQHAHERGGHGDERQRRGRVQEGRDDLEEPANEDRERHGHEGQAPRREPALEGRREDGHRSPVAPRKEQADGHEQAADGEGDGHRGERVRRRLIQRRGAIGVGGQRRVGDDAGQRREPLGGAQAPAAFEVDDERRQRQEADDEHRRHTGPPWAADPAAARGLRGEDGSDPEVEPRHVLDEERGGEGAAHDGQRPAEAPPRGVRIAAAEQPGREPEQEQRDGARGRRHRTSGYEARGEIDLRQRADEDDQRDDAPERGEPARDPLEAASRARL